MTLQRLYSDGAAKRKSRAERKGGRELWNGERIKEIREARGLSRPELAEKAGINTDDLGRHERNDTASNPGVDVLMRIARALDVLPGALFESKGAPVPRPEEGSVRVRRVERDPVLEQILEALDAETPAVDSWQGDVLKAVAALNRALRRSSAPGEAPAVPQKAGR